tara:strand:- start:723 stop:908 length:186 start_codon:yes stop_codon:yes gene_type:complete
VIVSVEICHFGEDCPEANAWYLSLGMPLFGRRTKGEMRLLEDIRLHKALVAASGAAKASYL